jgi:hypothetical protein
VDREASRGGAVGDLRRVGGEAGHEGVERSRRGGRSQGGW